MRYLANGTLLSLFMLLLTACTGDSPKITSFTSNPSTPVEAGSTVKLTAVYIGGTGSIDNGVGSITSGSTAEVTVDVTTTYTITIIDGAGDTATSSVTVTVGVAPEDVVAPTITSFTPVATTIAIGGSVDLSAVFENGTAVIDNGAGSITSGSSVTVSPTTTTTYTLTVTNTANTSVTSTVTVDVVKLDALSISAGTLVQTFQADSLRYDATVGFLASAIKVKASTVDAGSSIEVNNIAVDANNLSQFISLAPSTNTITITVTKNAVTQTYVLIITRQTISNLAEQALLHASDAQIDDYFGSSVSIDGDTLVVGAFEEDGGPGDPVSQAGAVYIYTRSGTSWTPQQILHASDKQTDIFGISVSIDGDTLVVGAYAEDGGPGDPVSNAGAAYVFTRKGSTWTEQQILHASDAQVSDLFGFSVSIDGDTIVVGAEFENGGPGDPITDAGAAYVYTRSGSTWTEQQILHAGDAEASDSFGESVSISGDTIVVGAHFEDTPASFAGAAYVFIRSDSTWTQQQILHASDAQSGDVFGESVSISGDTIVVGASSEDGGPGDPKSSAGAAYVFTRLGAIWTPQQILRASDTQASDGFGWSVSIDGDTIVVAALYEDGGSGDPKSNAGAAYVFTRFGATWTEQQILRASDTQANDVFGWSVSIDGGTIVVGAYREDGGPGDPVSQAGAAYVYK